MLEQRTLRTQRSTPMRPRLPTRESRATRVVASWRKMPGNLRPTRDCPRTPLSSRAGTLSSRSSMRQQRSSTREPRRSMRGSRPSTQRSRCWMPRSNPLTLRWMRWMQVTEPMPVRPPRVLRTWSRPRAAASIATRRRARTRPPPRRGSRPFLRAGPESVPGRPSTWSRRAPPACRSASGSAALTSGSSPAKGLT